MGSRKQLSDEKLYTPQLAGSSKSLTRTIQHPFKHRLKQDNSSLDWVPSLETKRDKRISDVNEVLLKQREMAETTLKRASSQYTGLFKTPCREESTVNESDLMRMSDISSFGQNVHVASTPRASARDSLDVHVRQTAEESRRQSEMLEDLIHKLKTSGMHTIVIILFLNTFSIIINLEYFF